VTFLPQKQKDPEAEAAGPSNRVYVPVVSGIGIFVGRVSTVIVQRLMVKK
jgi:hypothetical protein